MGRRWSCIAGDNESVRRENPPPKWNFNPQTPLPLSSPAPRNTILSDLSSLPVGLNTQSSIPVTNVPFSPPSVGRVQFNNYPRIVRNLDVEISRKTPLHDHPFTFGSPTRSPHLHNDSRTSYGHSPHHANSRSVSSRSHYTRPNHSPFSHASPVQGSPISVQPNPDFYQFDSPDYPGNSSTRIPFQEVYQPQNISQNYPLYSPSQYAISSLPFPSVYTNASHEISQQLPPLHSPNAITFEQSIENNRHSCLGLHLDPEYTPSVDGFYSATSLSHQRHRLDSISSVRAAGEQHERHTQGSHPARTGSQIPSAQSSPPISVRQTDGKVFISIPGSVRSQRLREIP